MVTGMLVSFVFFRYGYKLDLGSLCSSIRVYMLVRVNPFWLLSIEWFRGKGDDGSSPLGIDHEFTAFLDHGLKVRGTPSTWKRASFSMATRWLPAGLASRIVSEFMATIVPRMESSCERTSILWGTFSER